MLPPVASRTLIARTLLSEGGSYSRTAPPATDQYGWRLTSPKSGLDLASEASEEIATRFLEAIEAEFILLTRSPFLGVHRGQFGSGLRVVFHSPYAIYYFPTARQLVIVRVLHGALDVHVIAEQGGFTP